MSAADSAAGEFDPRFFEVFGCLGQLLSHIQEAVRAKAAGGGPGWAGGPWEHAFGRQKTRRAWPGGFPGKPGGFPGGPGGFGGPWGWPGPAGKSPGPKAGRGDVRAAILALLREGPRNGYQIMSEIEERSGGAWRPSPGAIYPALQRLEDAGMIVGEDTSDDRRVYRLTDEGRKIAERLKADGVTPWESIDPAAAAHLELKREIGQLARAVMQVARDGSPQQRQKVETLLAGTRRAIYRILGEEEAGADAAEAEASPSEG